MPQQSLITDPTLLVFCTVVHEANILFSVYGIFKCKKAACSLVFGLGTTVAPPHLSN